MYFTLEIVMDLLVIVAGAVLWRRHWNPAGVGVGVLYLGLNCTNLIPISYAMRGVGCLVGALVEGFFLYRFHMGFSWFDEPEVPRTLDPESPRPPKH